MTEQSFRDAVAAQSQCDFSKVLACVEIVVSIVAIAYGCYAAIGTALDGVQTLSKTTGENGLLRDKNFVEGATIVGGNIGTIASDIEAVRKKYNELRAQLEDDKNLIVIEKGNFEKLLEAYKDIPEAKPFKEEFDQYVKTVDARNQKKLLYTESILKSLTLEAEIKSIEVDVSKIDWENDVEQNRLDTIELQTFIDKMYFQTKANVLYLLYLEKKSIDFWSLENSKNIGIAFQKDISQLRAAHIDNRATIIKKMEERGQGANNANDVNVIIKKENYPLSFAQFAKKVDEKHVFVITLDLAQPPFNARPWKEIFADTLKIYLNGVTTDSKELAILVRHAGNSTFKNINNASVSFTHKQSSYAMTYNQTDKAFVNEEIPKNLVGNAREDKEDIKYIGISPFATWEIEIADNGITNKGLDVSNISEIILSFSFSYRTS
jgi:hypothetical protein